jgi:hypothetical protein
MDLVKEIIIFGHEMKKNLNNLKKNLFCRMTSYDGKLRHLPHLSVSTVSKFFTFFLKNIQN